MKKFIYSIMAACAMVLTTSCENGDREFEDFDYQTVYFAKQTPIRTIVLGDDGDYDTTLDNEHKCKIMVTLGGIWKNRTDRHVKIAVDNSLCDGLEFSDGRKVTPMPENYYRLTSTDITIKTGEIAGGTVVELTDEFFNDPLAVDVNYVIPVKIISADVDSVLSGTPKVNNPTLTNVDHWSVQPKNFQLYAVKYKNKMHGAWLSHGTDELNTNGVITTVSREPEYLEKAEERYLSSVSLNSSIYKVSTTVDLKVINEKGEVVDSKQTLTCALRLDFDNSDNCIVSTSSADCTASGSGKWEYKAAKKAWGDKDRDQITLDYEIRYNYTELGEPRYRILKAKDVLVMRDRQSKLEEFSYTNN